MITSIKDLREYPDTHTALLETEYYLATARVTGVSVLKLVHPVGRVAMLVRRTLRRHKAEGRIQFLIKGECFSVTDDATRYLLDRHPSVADDEDLDKQNAEITVVCLN